MSTSDYAVVDPATGETIKTYDTISDADLSAAIDRAADAHRQWGRETTLEQRAEVIGRVAALHEERKNELAEIKATAETTVASARQMTTRTDR